MSQDWSTVDDLARLVREVWHADGSVFVCGNGGSAADSQHMAAEFCSQLSKEFVRPGLPSIALTTDTSFLTAFANDFGFEQIFARQIESMVTAGDVLIALSTSGNSPNILRGVETGRTRGAFLVALTGETGGALPGKVDLLLNIPSQDPQRIQESHITIGHIACSLIEQLLYPALF